MDDEDPWFNETTPTQEIFDCVAENDPDLKTACEAITRLVALVRDLHRSVEKLTQQVFGLEANAQVDRLANVKPARSTPTFREGSAGEAVLNYCRMNKGMKTKTGRIAAAVGRGNSDVSTALQKIANCGLIKCRKKMGYWIL